MNPDDYITGTYSEDNPANQPDYPYEHEKELTIREALETGYDDKLLEAIGRNETLLSHIESELKFCIDVLAQTDNTFIKNRLIKLKKQLQ